MNGKKWRETGVVNEGALREARHSNLANPRASAIAKGQFDPAHGGGQNSTDPVHPDFQGGAPNEEMRWRAYELWAEGWAEGDRERPWRQAERGLRRIRA